MNNVEKLQYRSRTASLIGVYIYLGVDISVPVTLKYHGESQTNLSR